MVLDRVTLEEWKKETGLTWTWLAKQTNVQAATIFQQLGGRTGVSLRFALALEEATGIPVRQLVKERGADG